MFYIYRCKENENQMTNYTKDTARLARAFEQSESLIKRNGEGKIIGIVRWITDFATIAFIQDILIHPRYQRQRLETRRP
ncbi:hypothetical protein EfmAA242_11430 [Enterococcus faecium]|nr:hypothetical protein EfmAA242_11430 [Enterococcus faecium]